MAVSAVSIIHMLPASWSTWPCKIGVYTDTLNLYRTEYRVSYSAPEF